MRSRLRSVARRSTLFPAMSFYEGLHADLTRGGGNKRDSLLVRVFLRALDLFDRARRRLRRR